MKLAALCCTYHRPHTLGQLIESFLRQDYPKELRELIILDDAGQYENQEGDGWRVVSIPRRFHSLGEKRNACAALASPDVEGFLVADDDDIYLPHWFRASADALAKADWSHPSLVLLEHGEGLKEHETGGLYHGGWAFRREAFYRVRGYRPLNNGEDQDLAARLCEVGVKEYDPCRDHPPFYVFRNDNGSYHLSWMGDDGYEALADKKADWKVPIEIGWPVEYDKLPVIRKYVFAPHVAPCDDGKMRVELIGPVDAPGGNGPTNGMYALQKALKKKIKEDGIDWLTIKPLPASKGALPWFWHWDDRRYAAWWDSEGLPFIQGPNMLFTNSATPRIDWEECALLDAKNCRAMFCHSQWYKELIEKHKGPENEAPVITWPYPIDPMPGGPLPAKYDLLIYSKNGYRPGLLEYLEEIFPRHITFHYGHYRREELYDAARRSRACAYLADDDHGPLALAEILCAGCPAVGVRTGAPFIEEGVTGYFADRLPPGRASVASDEDREMLTSYVKAIRCAQTLNRSDLRLRVIDEFAATSTIDRLASILHVTRWLIPPTAAAV